VLRSPEVPQNHSKSWKLLPGNLFIVSLDKKLDSLRKEAKTACIWNERKLNYFILQTDWTKYRSKIWSFHGGDCEECRLLKCYAPGSCKNRYTNTILFFRSMLRLLVTANVVLGRRLSPWKRRWYVPPKSQFLQEPHGVTTQKREFFKCTSSMNSNYIVAAVIKHNAKSIICPDGPQIHNHANFYSLLERT
jgi:hypothetical protein